MTNKQKDQIVDIINMIIESATHTQKAVDHGRDILFDYIENLNKEKFQEGIDYAIGVIADEFRDYEVTERDLKDLF